MYDKMLVDRDKHKIRVWILFRHMKREITKINLWKLYFSAPKTYLTLGNMLTKLTINICETLRLNTYNGALRHMVCLDAQH
jgi:hypothetical protein